jgi:acyl-CoA hydrolase
MSLTLSHRLILPADSNHHGTLYAGSLLRIALEAGYATACRSAGHDANVLLRRVHNLECLKPVPVGRVVELRGRILHRTRAYLVVGLLGHELEPGQGPWMEALLGFVQVDEQGRPSPLVDDPELDHPSPADPDHLILTRLRERLRALLAIK